MNKMKYINENIKRNLKIPDNIIKIFTIISHTIFKYIKDNLNNKNKIEKKLLDINNYIKEIFKKSQHYQSLQKSEEILPKSSSKINILLNPEKSNNSKKKILKNKNINNKNLSNSIIISDMNSNQYLTFKLKKKLKQEHDKNKIKELEYLERIAILQFKLNLYEQNLEKLILENKITNKIKLRNNSLNNCTSTKFYYKIKNSENNNLKEKDRNAFRPLSNAIDSKISNLKKYFNNLSEIYNTKNITQTYISANTNTNFFDSYVNRNLKRNGYSNISDLHYKYQVGNNYLRNDFRKIKKTIHKNNSIIDKLMNNCE